MPLYGGAGGTGLKAALRGRGRSVFPILDLDFLSGALDPRFTFTSTAGGTYYDATGVQQTAGANVPRFDHRPDTLARRGLRFDIGTVATMPLSLVPGFVQGEGTLVVEVETIGNTGIGQTLADLNNGGTDRVVILRLATAIMRGSTLINNGTTSLIPGTTTTENMVVRAAIGYKTNSVGFAYLGSFITPEDTDAAMPMTLTTLRLGSSPSNTQLFIGWLRRLTLYSHRLDNATLTRLTVP